MKMLNTVVRVEMARNEKEKWTGEKEKESKGHPRIGLRFFVDLEFNVHRVVWIVHMKLYYIYIIYIYIHYITVTNKITDFFARK